MGRFVLAWSPTEWSPTPLVFWRAASSLQFLPLPPHGFSLSMCFYLWFLFREYLLLFVLNQVWPLLSKLYLQKPCFPPPQKNHIWGSGLTLVLGGTLINSLKLFFYDSAIQRQNQTTSYTYMHINIRHSTQNQFMYILEHRGGGRG